MKLVWTGPNRIKVLVMKNCFCTDKSFKQQKSSSITTPPSIISFLRFLLFATIPLPSFSWKFSLLQGPMKLEIPLHVFTSHVSHLQPQVPPLLNLSRKSFESSNHCLFVYVLITIMYSIYKNETVSRVKKLGVSSTRDCSWAVCEEIDEKYFDQTSWELKHQGEQSPLCISEVNVHGWLKNRKANPNIFIVYRSGWRD